VRCFLGQRGGFAVDCPEANSRVILGTNTYDVFDIERFMPAEKRPAVSSASATTARTPGAVIGQSGSDCQWSPGTSRTKS
jgi:hypothetical protein